ncbi:MAG TPA: NUDIX hydrolase [Methylomirabilota bacterium]
MSDAHHHHHGLSPSSIRFCPLCGGALARQPVPPEGKQEMVCGGCAFIFYLNHKVVAGTIPELEGRVLLTRRSIEPARGKWTYPGGFVDWGEAVEAAAVRETREETGLEVDLDGLLGVYSYPGTPIVIVVYRARVIGGEVRTCWENDCVEWVAPGDIPWEQLAFPSTTEALRAYLNGKDSRP